MGDFPLALLTATIWMYWFCVGVMIVRVRRSTRHGVGLVPEQREERYMWLLWVPLIAAWVTVPYLAHTHSAGPLAVPAFTSELPMFDGLRWIAAIVAVVCLAFSIRCWSQMGKNWRMDVSLTDRTELITNGLFRRIRHPIYAFSMLLMLCSAIIVPTPLMLAIAAIHIVLMNMKARNEERHLLLMHGDAYANYIAHTGRFFPRAGS